MTKSICAKCSGQDADNKWLPSSVAFWREAVLPRIFDYELDDSDPNYAIFSNIAYNLQYLEFINRCFEELYLTSAIRAQNVKTFTLTTSQIIECLIYIKLLDMKMKKDDIRESARALHFAKEKNVFGLGYNFYQNDLYRLKDLRNKIHLQLSEGINDADYMIFEKIDVLNDVKNILFCFMQKCLKLPTNEMNDNFPFLLPTKEFIHSKKEE